MIVERFIRALIVAAACFTAAWWLLRDAPEQVQLSASMPAQSGVLPARAAESRENAAGRNNDVVAVVPLAARGGDEPRPVAAPALGGTVEPIPMIEGIMLPGGMWNLHAQMEREPRETEWADEKERQISMYLASKAGLGRNFSQPSVLCRTSFCEIQVVGYGPGAFDTWTTATEDLRDQPWGRDLRGGGIYTVERAPNEQAVVLILMRQPRVQRDGLGEFRLAPAPAR